MAGFLTDLPDAYLREMAEHFAALDLPYPAPTPRRVTAAAWAAGQRLAQHGDAAHRLPACTACHGAALTGALPAMPGLLGLPRDYVVAQLGAWRNGSRRASAPDCMAEVARRLTLEDIVQIADWLAVQAVPEPMRPASAPAPTTAAPLACGSAGYGR